MYEQPLMRSEKRMAQPTSVFGRFHNSGNLGGGLGLKAHGMSDFPKVGANITPKTSGIAMGVKPLKTFASGGIAHFDGGGDVDNVSSTMPDQIQPAISQDTSGLSSNGIGSYQPAYSSVAGMMDPYTGTGDAYHSQSDVAGLNRANQNVQQANTTAAQGLPQAPAAPAAPAQQPSGIQGWLQSKHFGGITGNQYMQAGLTALTGILAGIAANKSRKAGQQYIANAQNPTQWQGVKNQIAPIGVPLAFAKGGPVKFDDGGLSLDNPPSINVGNDYSGATTGVDPYMQSGALAANMPTLPTAPTSAQQRPGQQQQQQQPDDSFMNQVAAAHRAWIAGGPGYAKGGMIKTYNHGGMSGDCYDDGGQMQDAPPPQQNAPQQDPTQTPPSQNSPISQAITAGAIKALLGQSANPQKDIQDFVKHFGPDALQALVQQVQQAKQGQNQPLNASGASGIGQGVSNPQNSSPMQPAAPNGQQMASQSDIGMASGGPTGQRNPDGSLDGAGDGLSDDIVANQGTVRVGNGEHVIDAATVADIGGGSSKAGSRKIMQATQALRQKKHGTTKQPPMVKDSVNPMLKVLSGQ